MKDENLYICLIALGISYCCRYDGPGLVPIVRHVSWPTTPERRIAAMVFGRPSRSSHGCHNRSIKWLLCALENYTLALLPIHYLVTQTGVEHKLHVDAQQPSYYLSGGEDDGVQSGPRISDGRSPVQNLMRQSSIGHFDRLTIIPAPSRLPSKGRGQVVSCLWWRARSNVDYCILVLSSGYIFFINLRTKADEHSVRMKGRIGSCQMGSEPKQVGIEE